jgi:hypothetical protein
MLLLCALMAGCASTLPPLTGIVPGRTVTTLQSPVSLSVVANEQQMGGRGYLIYQQPDRFHLVVLSPFGMTLLEMFVDGERLTWLVPGKGVAYQGALADLPDRQGMHTWTMMRWVVENPPPAGPATYREYRRPDGGLERVWYDRRGLVVRKANEAGDEVAYREYREIDGVAVATVLEIASSDGERVTITFDEPELNKRLEEAVLVPNLDGLTLLPLSEFKGF